MSAGCTGFFPEGDSVCYSAEPFLLEETLEPSILITDKGVYFADVFMPQHSSIISQI